MKVDLTEEEKKFFESFPESGMGYHNAIIVTKDEKRCKVQILNCDHFISNTIKREDMKMIALD